MEEKRYDDKTASLDEVTSLGYAAGRDTSLDSAVRSKINAAHLRSMVYEMILNAGVHGITADEATEQLGAVHNSIAPRLTELSQRELIKDSTLRRQTRMGRRAIVWVASGETK